MKVDPFFRIRPYHAYLSPRFARRLLSESRAVAAVPGLREVGTGGGLETPAALEFLVEIYRQMEPLLRRVLDQRVADRAFLDERVKACDTLNREQNLGVTDEGYHSVIGLRDGHDRVVVGPLRSEFAGEGGDPIAPLPDFLKGPHVTLFGPPDSAKLALNAMNAFHRRLPDEPPIVESLLADFNVDGRLITPMWGADDEDSKTPLRADLVDAGVNLTACFNRTLSAPGYTLASDRLSLPIKRFPGLALPSSFLFYEENPVPLHLYDFALHLFHNHARPEALVFYVPKLENEEEAAYLHAVIENAEARLKEIHPAYRPGSVRLMVVLENPRAILRAHEIIDALHPYFAGASLGWHDYLASTARLLKHDSNYRIPVKADPDIVIKHIKASHLLLAEAVGSRGGIQVGGMYGILPQAGHEASLSVTLKGFYRDVITQLKRELTGFWVAHPDFVRLGLAIVAAWRARARGDREPLRALIAGTLSAEHAAELSDFIEGPDSPSLDRAHPGYVRSLLVANIAESDTIANNDPEEIRYNVFQSLQYLTDWLSGNGCVALPTALSGTPVRVMDDLATAERSRWEVWHEIHHGRFSLEDFIRISHEELNFIRRDLSDARKIVQVKWDDRTRKWYPIAYRLMLKLMTDANPVEFATELLLPFTAESVRAATDPWDEVMRTDSAFFALEPAVARYDHAFEICGTPRFAATLAAQVLPDLAAARECVLSFTRAEVEQAAAFHGDIGQSAATLDARASREQAKLAESSEAERVKLAESAERYRKKFGFKFLISAQGRSGAELQRALAERLDRSPEEELSAAREALWEISRKRLGSLEAPFAALLGKHGVAGASIALMRDGAIQTFSLGRATASGEDVTTATVFEIASLSKTLASAFALEYFRERSVALSSSVNRLLAQTRSAFRIPSPKSHPAWGDAVTLEHLLNHTALNLHYVKGVPPTDPFPRAREFLEGANGYAPIEVRTEPGSAFGYSGGGFLVLEHLIDAMEEPYGRTAASLGDAFLERLGIHDLCFIPEALPNPVAHGFQENGAELPGGRLRFPAFAAGAVGSASAMLQFNALLTQAYQSVEGAGALSHDTAVRMLHARDLGSGEFMGAAMGLGVFVVKAGANRLAIHQGANDGFRALYVHCYRGPDAGKGFVILANADRHGVAFIAEAAQAILAALPIGGIDFARLGGAFNPQGVAVEELVNRGYKQLLFDAFLPDRAEPIDRSNATRDALADWNLAVGARIVSVSNDGFARAENLLSPFVPQFDPELYERQGKVMDSWESVRHNPLPFDSLTLELPVSSTIIALSLSTRYHDGNQAEAVEVLAQTEEGEPWFKLLAKTQALGHAHLELKLAAPVSVKRVEVRMHPDGGLSRLGLYGELPRDAAARFREDATFVRYPDEVPKSRRPLTLPYTAPPTLGHSHELASSAVGGRVVSATNEHYGPASQVISPFPPLHMFDGLESARSREAGHSEAVVIALGRASRIGGITLDFTHFLNNNPREVSIEACASEAWVELIPRTSVKAYAGNTLRFEIRDSRVFSQIRVRTFPDGGINRIRVYSPDPVE